MTNKIFRMSLLAFFIVFAGVQGCFSQDRFSEIEPRIHEPGTPFYHIDFARFPTPQPDSSRVVLYVKVPYDDLQFVKYNDEYQAKYEVSVVVFDKDGVQADGTIKRFTVKTKNFNTTNDRTKYHYTQYTFFLHNSTYKLNVGLMDLDTRKTTYRKSTVNLSQFGREARLHLSDLVIVDQVDSLQSPVTVAPNVLNRLDDQEKNFLLYFTVLGDKGPAVVESVILTTKKDRIKSTIDTLSLSGQPDETYVKMDTKGLNYANYIYKITIKQGKNEVTRRKEFRVSWVGMSGYIGNLDEAIEQMIYIMSVSEINRMKSLKPKEKKSAFQKYWHKRDETPNTEVNEVMNEYYRRVHYATEHFGSSLKEGWRTDMGMVYILFGAPNDIERHPFDLGSKPYEIWYYFELNRQFVFVDDTGFGDYRLVTPLYELYNTNYR